MASETLMTFTFDAPATVQRVELLGSWDSFTHAYPMQPDQRRGPGHWTGCFHFSNIVFDGEHFTAPRCGGLVQGGLYWYFFRLDDMVEAYDDRRENTADCPLLPGQPVNVIDIPYDLDEENSRVSLDLGMLEKVRRAMKTKHEHEYTLDPASRYRPLSRPSSFSKAHRKESLDRRRAEQGAETQVTSLTPSLADLATTLMQVDTAPAQHHEDTVSRPELDEYSITPHQQVIDYDIHAEDDHMDYQHDSLHEMVEEEGKMSAEGQSVRSYAATIDISSARAVPLLRGPSKLHLRTLSGPDRCYRVDTPHEPRWKNTYESMIQSLRRYYYPVVS